MKAKKKGTVSKDLQTPVICGFVITLEITPPILDYDDQNTEETKDWQCPAGYSHNRAFIYIMTGREIAITKN